MLLIEPPSSPADLHFRIFGIPVRVHPLFWLMTLVLAANQRDPVKMLLWVATVFVSILVHELGHALAARMHGWQPWITLYSMGGLASYRPTYHTTRSQVIILLAGPGAGFLFIALILAAVQTSGHQVTWDSESKIPHFVFESFDSENVNDLIFFLEQVNIFWGLVNLLPVFPLDGGQISRELMIHADPARGSVQSLWLSVFAAALVAVASILWMDQLFLAFFFGYLAYTSFTLIEQLRGHGGGSSW